MPRPPTTWKLTLSYDGAPFHGWQVQPGRTTVQGTLAAAIQRVTGETMLPQGSGRTDAGVHALGQAASFTLAVPIPAANLLHALNRALPSSIRILAVEPAPDSFHARHSAVRKTYEYRIFERRLAPKSPGGPFMPSHLGHAWGSENTHAAERICSPFLAPYVWDCHWPLQLEPMQAAAALLSGTHDFTSFAASDPDLALRTQVAAGAAGLSATLRSGRDDNFEGILQADRSEEVGGSRKEVSSRPKSAHFADAAERLAAKPPPSSAPNPLKTLYSSAITREDGLLLYRVTGSGFLHHMVRNLVGTLVEIGRGALQPADIPRILERKDRAAAGPTAPAQGLYLVRVEYLAQQPGAPYLDSEMWEPLQPEAAA